MPFPNSPRVIYGKNPLAEVVCAFQFPPILKIETGPPAAFQDLIRQEYPLYSQAQPQVMNLPPNLPPQVAKLLTGFGQQPGMEMRHEFSSDDGKWQVVLTRDKLVVKTVKYQRWEEFRDRTHRLHDSLINIYAPSSYSRVGLLYLNVIRKSILGFSVDEPWARLLQSYVGAELSVPEIAEQIDETARRTHMRLKESAGFMTLETGIAMVGDNKEKCFLIKSDFHTHEKTEISNAFTLLDAFNKASGRLFRWCIQQRLHDALHPTAV
jgi:uncharacterized protein (TIGR04255 family)